MTDRFSVNNTLPVTTKTMINYSRGNFFSSKSLNQYGEFFSIVHIRNHVTNVFLDKKSIQKIVNTMIDKVFKIIVV